jgi:hypothetical protein
MSDEQFTVDATSIEAWWRHEGFRTTRLLHRSPGPGNLRLSESIRAIECDQRWPPRTHSRPQGYEHFAVAKAIKTAAP